MQFQSKVETASLPDINSVDNSILGVFAGTGVTLFGFLVLIVLLA